MSSKSRILVAFVLSMATAPHDAAAQPDPPNACVIHIWPADTLHTLTEGAVWNNVVDSAFRTYPGRTPERQVPPHGPLDPPGQRRLLATLDLPMLLHSPGATVVLHEDSSTRRPTGPATGRQTPSRSPCYVEVTVAKNFFNRSGLTSNTLRTLFIYDDYRDQLLPVRSFVAWGASPLTLFPAKQPDQAVAADTEIAEAFKANVLKFSNYAFATPRKKQQH